MVEIKVESEFALPLTDLPNTENKIMWLLLLIQLSIIESMRFEQNLERFFEKRNCRYRRKYRFIHNTWTEAHMKAEFDKKFEEFQQSIIKKLTVNYINEFLSWKSFNPCWAPNLYYDAIWFTAGLLKKSFVGTYQKFDEKACYTVKNVQKVGCIKCFSI